MNQLNSINRISSLLSRFVVQVKGLNSISQYGINYLSETVLIPLFSELFEFDDLVNLNSESANFPGIDIGDRNKRVAFQISSNTDLEKVKHTLKQFNEYKHYESFDRLFIFCITEKGSINPKSLNEIIEGKFMFNVMQNLLDYKDLLKEINRITDYDKIIRIENLLNKQFSEIKLDQYKGQLESSLYETVFTNLLRISFPSRLYTARLSIHRKDLQNTRARIFNDRELIFQYKKENGLRFSADWIDYQKQIYSFHDLSNFHHDLSRIIDIGTVEILSPEEFYNESQDHERAFKALLKFCFSKHANFLGIEFRHKENIFIFKSEEESIITRRESWNSGKRSASRDVIKVKLNQKNNDAWYYTHLAFSISFKYYNSQWFLEITPDWFITKDGVTKHYLMDKQVSSWLKKKERNLHVLNNTKFIANYLKYGKSQPDLFQIDNRRPKNFLNFLNFETFKNSPYLNEEDWKSKESEELIELMTDKQGNVETEL